MATTYEEFSAKLDRLDEEFNRKMQEQNAKFFADKPDESTLSPEMKEHYEKFERMIKEHTEKFNKKMHEHSEHFKQKFAELLEQQKAAQNILGKAPEYNLSWLFGHNMRRVQCLAPNFACEFSAKLDRLDEEFNRKMQEQNAKFFADKPDESTLSPEMKEHYEKFERMIKEHTEKFNKKMHEHSEHFKQKFAELLEQQKAAQYPSK
ncbi:Kinetoplastid membrane protein 11 family protein [Leishmania donovani]|uniref:Kinetoplastid membrane protein 11 family protein n=1 Tax=Leishmania donovani TaxID=5661 RepID=A0A504XPQ7_LEIDO|nr:Kinetoplastid membrane protein 11 family protein [Leishmania donovani]